MNNGIINIGEDIAKSTIILKIIIPHPPTYIYLKLF